ncbi:hypothetical protein [Arenimonas metalli]|uniref:Uncharacterized protein n=1 Tax=Arenimonas metalli CF5-1 TaxID=1384056 RepID=A0A091AQQ0_9GAMM|nr:hypothetical protein [Arenimonas metalli]KFN41716.1 hypothetical protein N787_05455 [Arenimonas metalli CF5-1]
MPFPAALRRLLVLAALAWAPGAAAYIVPIDAGDEAVYLRVGDGTFVGTYANGGTPVEGVTGAISRVSVTVPQASVGNGTPQVMSANGRLTSDWDNFLFCEPGQLYIGGFYRRPNNGNFNATLSVTVPANLVNESGDTIPMSQLSWTSSGNGDGAAAQPIPSGSFNPGTTPFPSETFRRNTWRESCLTFRYANSAVVPGGTYTARVTFTLASP